MLHVSGHAQASLGVFSFSLGVRIAKKNQNSVTDKFIDRPAVLECDIRHLGKVLVQQQRDLLRLQAFYSCRKILDVGKENRELLALSVNGDILLAAEYTLVDLRREVARDLRR